MKSNVHLRGDRVFLEVSEARLIHFDYLASKDKKKVKNLCLACEKFYGKNSSKRIFEYFKKFLEGKFE